jgi:pimeloyl-ACP methyl ester carboxylesterase
VAVAAFTMGACGPSFDDPAGARCDSPEVTYGQVSASTDHRQVDVAFTCVGASQAGTLYLPADDEGHPAVIWVHGAGEATRLPFEAPIVSGFVREGIAFFSYDKRGVGDSEGECCPGDYGHFNLLTADVVGAIVAVRGAEGVEPEAVGLIGASQAGWIAPRSAAESGHVAFTALASAAVLPYEEIAAYADLTGGDGSADPFPSSREIADTLDGTWEGMDPRLYLEHIDVPELFLLGDADREIPYAQTVDVLDHLKADGASITVASFSGAGHGLLDVPPTDPNALPTLISWVVDLVGDSPA